MFDTSRPGPMYEDFSVGATLPPLPAITLTEGDNSFYRAVTGDQHALAADTATYRAIGGSSALVNPALVMQMSIGQSTMATRQAIANLYYRQVRVLRPVEVGETLATVTTVLGLADSSPKGDQHRGKVWLGIRTTGNNGPVVSYERCALVRARGMSAVEHADEIPGPSGATPFDELSNTLPDWDLSVLSRTDWPQDECRVDPLRDHIDLAAPLARMTFNQAAVHRDLVAVGWQQRLVFGGHVQGLAQASLTRMLPGLAHVPAWDGCDHLGPAYEGDLLEFRHTLLDEAPAGRGRLLRFEVMGAKVTEQAEPVDILRWSPIIWAP